ncbi:MAG: LuxR C-terminal-related transcriptional regulator [Chloroflexota bacterium]
MNPRDELTNQECNVLALVAQGWRTTKIARELFISPRTVETHLYHIFEKLDVSSRTEAALYALHGNLTVNANVSRNSADR